ncbi:hypothetical protein [Algibacter mikhailovii]|uniref:Uncharacterized protein n=1 Tax=Algibacter mikhailovii TaxID=425498 RepID=A0A918QVU0_9FLAO|nr:hypothetical protein [Algibacter mikhailovii]GGZ75061.1 hypothetical protein GCM10007028_10600 [Algibacter mikhailovii]
MRKLNYLLFILLFVILTLDTSAQTTFVPDDNFEQALQDLIYDLIDNLIFGKDFESFDNIAETIQR